MWKELSDEQREVMRAPSLARASTGYMYKLAQAGGCTTALKPLRKIEYSEA